MVVRIQHLNPVKYHKACVLELQERLRLKELENKGLGEINEYYQQWVSDLTEFNRTLGTKVKDLERQRIEDHKRHRRRIEEITTDFVKEKQEMLNNFDDYKKIFIEELKVRQVIETIFK